MAADTQAAERPDRTLRCGRGRRTKGWSGEALPGWSLAAQPSVRRASRVEMRAAVASLGVTLLASGCLAPGAAASGTPSSSETTVALQGSRPGFLYSLRGSERTAEGSLIEVGLVHALVLQPLGSGVGSMKSFLL